MPDRKQNVVIADDFSGAAEIAGFAWQSGKSVELLTAVPNEQPNADVVVIDTDTRLLPDSAAAERVAEVGRVVAGWRPDFIYKKVDSVLRGPVVAEIHAALEALGKERAVLVSANPSRNRIISDGIYFVDGVPLHETSFANDPTHPAMTSQVSEILNADSRIHAPNAESKSDLKRIAERIDSGGLPVGGADFYRTLTSAQNSQPQSTLPFGDHVFICGSQITRAERTAQFKASNVPVCELHESEETCVDLAINMLSDYHYVALELSDELPLDPDLLLSRIASTTKLLVLRATPDFLMLEGGATAKAIIDAFEWRHFTVEGVFADGVVGLRATSDNAIAVTAEGISKAPPLIVVKPGSYRWPDVLFHWTIYGRRGQSESVAKG
ncbi:MAG: four-carbon acid sugar kinase family protein, partial [Verrucomicrobiota bacterium]